MEIPLNFKSTSEIEVRQSLVEQVIGQEKAVEIIRKAAAQKRNVLLIGVPGIGKSMLAQAMAEILSVSRLYDVLVYPNEEDQNNPRVRVVRAGEGKRILHKTRIEAQKVEDNMRLMGLLFPLGWFFISYIAWTFGWIPDVVYAATLILGGILIFGFAIGAQMNRPMVKQTPKLLIDNFARKVAPFAEATGARAGALLGDVRHDPLQCILPDQLVCLPTGKQVKVAQLLDNYFKDETKSELELDSDEQFDVLSGIGEKFCYSDAKVSKVFRRHYDGDIIELKTRKGYSIKVTPNHPIAVFNGKAEIEFIHAGDIRKG